MRNRSRRNGVPSVYSGKVMGFGVQDTLQNASRTLLGRAERVAVAFGLSAVIAIVITAIAIAPVRGAER